MSRALDRIYDAAGALAAAAILGICAVVSAQIGLNIMARVAGPEWSWTIPSYADFAGFALASASFLALAHTLRRGAHIRVMLLTDRLPRGPRRLFEAAALALGAAVSGYATWYVVGLIGESLRYGDTSSGMVAVPLWIPQLPVGLGLALLTLALVQTLVEVARGSALPRGEAEGAPDEAER